MMKPYPVALPIQPEIIGGSRTNPPDQLIRAAVALARIGRLFGVPMTASVVQAGPGEPRLAPELAAELPGVVPLMRTKAAVFDDAPTAAAITARSAMTWSSVAGRVGARRRRPCDGLNPSTQIPLPCPPSAPCWPGISATRGARR